MSEAVEQRDMREDVAHMTIVDTEDTRTVTTKGEDEAESVTEEEKEEQKRREEERHEEKRRREERLRIETPWLLQT